MRVVGPIKRLTGTAPAVERAAVGTTSYYQLTVDSSERAAVFVRAKPRAPDPSELHAAGAAAAAAAANAVLAIYASSEVMYPHAVSGAPLHTLMCCAVLCCVVGLT
jgi:hypothetical protein